MPLTKAWTQLKAHRLQSQLWRTRARFCAVAAGRGSGKTELARRRLVRYLPIKKDWPDPLYFYAAPTYAQARRIAWNNLKSLVPAHWLKGPPSETDMIIRTIFGSELHVIGMDKPHRVEGVQWDGGVIDECSDQKPKVFDLSIRPALTHRNAWCWRIGVPKRHGCGAAEFRKCFDDDNYESYTWPSADILPAAEVQAAKNILDAKDFAEQFEASWVASGGLCFHGFTHERSVRPVTYRDDRPIYVGSDFNVTPMAWVIGHKTSEGFEQFDEIWKRDTNTPATLDLLHSRYPEHKAGWYFYGDATGRARKTSAAQSDYIHIRKDERFEGSVVRYPKANPSIKDRLASCNSLMQHSRYHVDPNCVKTIEDLEMRSLDATGNPDDTSPDIGHVSDALGYVLHGLYPIRYLTGGGNRLAVFGAVK